MTTTIPLPANEAGAQARLLVLQNMVPTIGGVQ